MYFGPDSSNNPEHDIPVARAVEEALGDSIRGYCISEGLYEVERDFTAEGSPGRLVQPHLKKLYPRDLTLPLFWAGNSFPGEKIVFFIAFNERNRLLLRSDLPELLEDVLTGSACTLLTLRPKEKFREPAGAIARIGEDGEVARSFEYMLSDGAFRELNHNFKIITNLVNSSAERGKLVTKVSYPSLLLGLALRLSARTLGEDAAISGIAGIESKRDRFTLILAVARVLKDCEQVSAGDRVSLPLITRGEQVSHRYRYGIDGKNVLELFLEGAA